MKKLVFFGFFKTIFSCSPLLSSEAVNFGSQPPLNFVSACFSCMEKGRCHRRRPAFSFRLNLFDSCMPFISLGYPYFRQVCLSFKSVRNLNSKGLCILLILLMTVSYSFWWRIGASAGFTLPSRMSAASSPVSRPSL